MSKMLYNGVLLPAQPSWDGMPPDYQFIFLSGGYYYLAGTNSAPFCVLVNGADRVALRADVIFTAFEAKAGAEEWGKLAYTVAPFATLTDEGYVFAEAITFIWTQRDIPSATAGEIYLEGTEPTEPEPEADPMIMYRRGWFDGFLTGIHIRGLLCRRTVEEPQPVTHYLYGSPSPTIVTYNGVELPELPEWDKSKYPYAYIREKTDGTITLMYSDNAFRYGTWVESSSGVSNTQVHIITGVGTVSSWCTCTLTDNEWGEAVLTTKDRTNATATLYTKVSGTVLWSNTDIPNIDNNTVYLTASEPVRTNSGNVALADGDGYVMYEGAVLPKLPEWDKEAYPYAVILPSTIVTNEGKYLHAAQLVVSTTNMEYSHGISGAFLWGVENGSSIIYLVNLQLGETTWTQTGENNFSAGGLAFSAYATYELRWANFEVMYLNESNVACAASDPIPLASSEPVAAVYGGVKLPVIDTVYTDEIKETHPYATIVNSSTKGYVFGASSVVTKAGSTGLVTLEVQFRRWKIVDGQWTALSISEMTTSTSGTPLFANYDLYNNDGTAVIVPASDPIPVYEHKE